MANTLIIKFIKFVIQIKAYFNLKKQRFHTQTPITSLGRPQNAVLDPLLFTLFINDICFSLMFSQQMIFADDTQIYVSCLPSELDRSVDLIAHDVGVLACYASDNSIKLRRG